VKKVGKKYFSWIDKRLGDMSDPEVPFGGKSVVVFIIWRLYQAAYQFLSQELGLKTTYNYYDPHGDSSSTEIRAKNDLVL
jgi:hypothetical protein